MPKEDRQAHIVAQHEGPHAPTIIASPTEARGFGNTQRGSRAAKEVGHFKGRNFSRMPREGENHSLYLLVVGMKPPMGSAFL
eukprot:9887127-Heterocapsa_arctica.AAC.1